LLLVLYIFLVLTHNEKELLKDKNNIVDNVLVHNHD